jgi:hypothetical protein
MASYFRQVPNFEYVNRRADNKTISDYVAVKNLFKRGKLRVDIFENLIFFTKYSIIGDERPDNIAFKFYDDSTLDWVVLLSNNILNLQSEWPTPQLVFDQLMLDKYSTYDNLYNGVHHYEVSEDVKNTAGTVLLKKGTRLPKNWNTNGNFIKFNNSKISQIFSGNGVIPSTKVTVTPKVGILNLKVGNEVVIENVSENEYNGRFVVTSVVAGSNDNIARAFTYELASTSTIANPTLSSNNSEEVLFKSETSGNSYYFEYYDDSLGYYQIIPTSSFIREVTNYQHEERLEDDKRNIYILKPTYLNVIFNDIEEIMPYKKGGDQYLTPTLKKGDNIRLYE